MSAMHNWIHLRVSGSTFTDDFDYTVPCTVVVRGLVLGLLLGVPFYQGGNVQREREILRAQGP